MITFILGGVKSGKTNFALKKGETIGSEKFYYIATARAIDEEMRQRIDKHKRERGSHWVTIEEPINLDEAIRKLSPNSSVVIDCLTTWLTNLIVEEYDFPRLIDEFIDSLRKSSKNMSIFIIANEVGLGIISENQLVRKFVDIAGTVNHKIMNLSDEAYFIVAGIPLKIK